MTPSSKQTFRGHLRGDQAIHLGGVTESTHSDQGFYAKLDEAKSHGRGSCCTAWSFFVLLGGILVVGIVLILM